MTPINRKQQEQIPEGLLPPDAILPPTELTFYDIKQETVTDLGLPVTSVMLAAEW